jgi:hypothetical protein
MNRLTPFQAIIAVLAATAVGVLVASQPAVAGYFGGATDSFHEEISCATGGTDISSPANTTTLNGAREMFVVNENTSVIHIYSTNGEAITEGPKICFDSTACTTAVLTLPFGPGVAKCAGVGGAVTLKVFGVR